MTLIRPQIALMDTDYFEQRIKTDDTDTTTDCTDGYGFFDNGLRRMTRIALIILWKENLM